MQLTMAQASQEEDYGSGDDDNGDDGNAAGSLTTVNVIDDEEWSKIKHTTTTINLIHIINTIT